jgi:hypothetical protein
MPTMAVRHLVAAGVIEYSEPVAKGAKPPDLRLSATRRFILCLDPDEPVVEA